MSAVSQLPPASREPAAPIRMTSSAAANGRADVRFMVFAPDYLARPCDGNMRVGFTLLSGKSGLRAGMSGMDENMEPGIKEEKASVTTITEAEEKPPDPP